MIYICRLTCPRRLLCTRWPQCRRWCSWWSPNSVSISYTPKFSHLHQICAREGKRVSTTTLQNTEVRDAQLDLGELSILKQVSIIPLHWTKSAYRHADYNLTVGYLQDKASFLLEKTPDSNSNLVAQYSGRTGSDTHLPFLSFVFTKRP